MFERNDYVKRSTASPYDGMVLDGDPPFEYGRIRIRYDENTYLVYWFGVDGLGPPEWSLKRATNRDLIPSDEKEYFQHCLKYGANPRS